LAEPPRLDAADDHLEPARKGAAVPVYQYRCKACGKVFEITCQLSERDEVAVCPDCGGKEVEQVFSSFTCAAPKNW
jgi:putative FmdB family regulatory protein